MAEALKPGTPLHGAVILTGLNVAVASVTVAMIFMLKWLDPGAWAWSMLCMVALVFAGMGNSHLALKHLKLPVAALYAVIGFMACLGLVVFGFGLVTIYLLGSPLGQISWNSWLLILACLLTPAVSFLALHYLSKLVATRVNKTKVA